jgi:hypothetical protein
MDSRSADAHGVVVVAALAGKLAASQRQRQVVGPDKGSIHGLELGYHLDLGAWASA